MGQLLAPLPKDLDLMASPAAQAPQAQAVQPQTPAQAAPSLTDLYLNLRKQGLDDAQATVALAQANRRMADIRSGLRQGAAIIAGRPYDADADRAQLMKEADAPLSDLATRQKAQEQAGAEFERQRAAQKEDIELTQQRALLDPSHPANVATRQVLGQLGMQVPAGLTAPTMPKELWATVQPLVEQRMKQLQVGAEAPERAARTKEALATADRIGALTPTEVTQKGAETREANARAANLEMQTTGQVAPGMTVTGTQGVTPKDRDELKAQKAVADKSSDLIDQINEITDGSDFVANPEKLAKLATLSNQLLLAGKEAAGIRGLPPADVAFLQNMTGNFSPFKLANIVGTTKNKERLQQLKSVIYNNLKQDAAARGVTFTPPRDASAAAVSGGTTAATHYRYSPDRKLRVPTDAKGNPLGKPEPNPNAPPVPNG